jgi:uncharacterized membrane protein YgcG
VLLPRWSIHTPGGSVRWHPQAPRIHTHTHTHTHTHAPRANTLTRLPLSCPALHNPQLEEAGAESALNSVDQSDFQGRTIFIRAAHTAHDNSRSRGGGGGGGGRGGGFGGGRGGGRGGYGQQEDDAAW